MSDIGSLVVRVSRDIQMAADEGNKDISAHSEFWVRFILKSVSQIIAYSGEYL